MSLIDAALIAMNFFLMLGMVHTISKRIDIVNQRVDIIREHLGLEVFNKKAKP